MKLKKCWLKIIKYNIFMVLFTIGNIIILFEITYEHESDGEEEIKN